MNTHMKYLLTGLSFVDGVCVTGISVAAYHHSAFIVPIVIATIIFGCCTLATLNDMERDRQ